MYNPCFKFQVLAGIRELRVSCSQLHAHTRPNATHTSRVFAGSALGTLLPATTVSEGFVSVLLVVVSGTLSQICLFPLVWWSPSRSGTPGSRFASLAPEALLQSRKGGTKHSHHQTSCQNVFQVFSVGKNVSWCSRARCLLEEASKTGN